MKKMIGSILLICSVLLIQNCTKPLPSGQVILQNSPHTGNYTGEEDYFLGSYAYEPIDSAEIKALPISIHYIPAFIKPSDTGCSDSTTGMCWTWNPIPVSLK